MKKFLCLLLLLSVHLCVFAKPGFKTLNYSFNYSKMKIDGQRAKQYVFSKVYPNEKDADAAFNRFKAAVENVFIGVANKEGLENHGYTLDNSEESRYEVEIFFLDVDEDGEHEVEANVKDRKDDNEVVATVEAKAGSGKYNTFYWLFLEQLATSGERFGDKLADEMDDL